MEGGIDTPLTVGWARRICRRTSCWLMCCGVSEFARSRAWAEVVLICLRNLAFVQVVVKARARDIICLVTLR